MSCTIMHPRHCVNQGDYSDYIVVGVFQYSIGLDHLGGCLLAEVHSLPLRSGPLIRGRTGILSEEFFWKLVLL